MELDKYKIKIREVIEHTYEVEAVNEYMAKEEAINRLKGEQINRIWYDKKDIFCEKISSKTTP